MASFAQDDRDALKDLIEKNKQWYLKEQYTIPLTYQLYNSHQDKNPAEAYDGAFVKNKEQTYFRMHQMEAVKLEPFFLQISRENNVIVISKENKDDVGFFDDVDKYLKYFEKVKKTKEGSLQKFILNVPKFTQMPYEKIAIFFNEKGEMKKQEMYLIAEVEYTSGEQQVKAQPKVIITYAPMENKIDTKLFQASRYVKASGKDYNPSENYKGFKVVKLD